MAGHGWPLVGRGDELAVLDQQVGREASCVVLAGPVGVGKSRLMATWLAGANGTGRDTGGPEAEQRGGARSAIVVRATRSTATIPFGAFAGWVPERLVRTDDRLAVLKATAARLAGPAGAAGRPGAARATSSDASASVVAVDDAHLLDEGSAALVLHLVQHTSLGVLLTVRQGERCPDAVVAVWKEGLAQRVDLGPLSEGDTAELLARVLGDPVGADARRRVWQVTRGNPLYLREVVEAALAQGVLVGAGGEWRWQGELTGPTRLVELVSDRIGAGDIGERRILELVALGEPLPVELLAQLASPERLAELEGRGLVIVDRTSRHGPERMARLAHPLYSEVLRAEMPAFTARSLWTALGQAAMSGGGGEMARRDPVRVATWLLDGGDEPTEPELLLRASLRARVVDDYALSARFAEAAERAGGGWQARLRRAIALGPLGRLDEADALLSSLSGPASEPAARVAAALVRAEQSFWWRGDDLDVARAIVAGAVETVPAPARSILLSSGAQLALLGSDFDESIRLATRAYNDAGSLVERLHAVTCAGLAAVFTGRTRAALSAVKLARPGVLEVMDDDPLPALFLAHTYSLASVLAGRLDEAAATFEVLLDQVVGSDRGLLRALTTYWCGRAALEQGRMATARRLGSEALELLGDANHYGRGAWVATSLAMAAAQSGDVDGAAAAIEWVEARTRARVEPEARDQELARAWLHAARGELSVARDLALATARRAAGAGAWMVEMLALLQVVRFGAPGVVAARLEELTGVVEGRYVVAAAGFARAAAEGDGPGLDEASERFAAMGACLHAAEAATAAVDAHAGDGQRRRQAASRATAQELAARCEGAVTPLLARLDHEPLVTALTDREHEVAVLAARGRTSREIAQVLAISMSTVHSHLNHAYTKLGIGDRAGLAAVLGLDANGSASGGIAATATATASPTTTARVAAAASTPLVGEARGDHQVVAGAPRRSW